MIEIIVINVKHSMYSLDKKLTNPHVTLSPQEEMLLNTIAESQYQVAKFFKKTQTYRSL